ncbi:hypothetical protein VPH35_110265 [Triticum aestivum]|uniref:Uncharacterized protein n=1 Tax=Triticum turgidum subsp. durum TaxID=4567 RepID=A0A9R1B9A1_TRITD|nr:unnamed protein product [Triticum turgidum subsp. durum]
MAWWRERVVAPVRRAWLAVARRAQNRTKCSLTKLGATHFLPHESLYFLLGNNTNHFCWQTGRREHRGGGPAQGRANLRIRRCSGDVEHAELGETCPRPQAGGA